MITQDQLKRFAGVDDQALVDSINAVTERFEINTARRLRYFMAQTSFETQRFTKFEEDLLYLSPDRLVAVWPMRFTLDPTKKGMAYAPDFVKNPQRLANLVYGGRIGNVSPNDGWQFRGRGGFGLTFHDNYSQYSHDVYGDERCIVDPDLVSKPPDAMLSAGWFWNRNGLNALADADQFTHVTGIVNGSTVTAPARIVVLNSANGIF
jgi:putative chitinase